MSIQIVRSTEAKAPSIVMCLYGDAGTGKTTLASTSHKPIFLDAENGTKMIGLRGIDVPIINIKTWNDVQDAWNMIKDDAEYKTVIVDPIGSFMDCLIESVRGNDQMDLRKWGLCKDKMRKFIFTLKESGKHCIFIAHTKEERDDEKVLRRPLLAANLSHELVNMCDIVAYLKIDQGKRVLQTQPSEKVYAKDRSSVLDASIENPNMTVIIDKIHKAFDAPPFPDKPSIASSESSHAMKMKEGISSTKQQ